jgi:non-heme chloroperoxidase
VLVIHGDADRILPFPNTGKRLPGLIKEMELVVIEDGPHAISWTHADQVNTALLRFLGAVSATAT